MLLFERKSNETADALLKSELIKFECFESLELEIEGTTARRKIRQGNAVDHAKLVQIKVQLPEISAANHFL